MAFLTVFTPAYNRAHTLQRTYESLCRQECKDFLWLIIDDGSTDQTSELVQSWQKKENGFEIQYIYKENGGMHTAHNTAYENIHTELNVCIDSDDWIAPGAVKKIRDTWEKVRDKGYAGMIALDADFSGNIIGKGFPAGMADTTLGGYYAAGGSGDKKLIYRTDVINSVPPYPVFPGEKYVGLVYKYILVDQKYKLYTFLSSSFQPNLSLLCFIRFFQTTFSDFLHYTSCHRLMQAKTHYCSVTVHSVLSNTLRDAQNLC